MAVHVPLSVEAQAEARFLMLSANNILKPQDGKPVVSPTQDMVLGCYYLTHDHVRAPRARAGTFTDLDEALMAYDSWARSRCRPSATSASSARSTGEEYAKIVETTVGRVIFNQAIPQDLGIVAARTPWTICSSWRSTRSWTRRNWADIVDNCYRAHGVPATATMLDNIKALGFKYLHARRDYGFRGGHHRAGRPSRRSWRTRKSAYTISSAQFRRGMHLRATTAIRASSRPGSRPPRT